MRSRARRQVSFASWNPPNGYAHLRCETPGLGYTCLEILHRLQEAINKLNSLQSNLAALEASRASGGRLVQFAKHEMVEYLGRIGYKACSSPTAGGILLNKTLL
jgi:hypothetical protein